MAFALTIDGSDTRRSKSQREVEERLETIFSWQAAPSYAYYLLDLPGVDLNLVGDNVGDIEQIQRNSKLWRPYDSVLHPAAAIRLSVPATMQALPPRYRICVTLDSLGVTVPAPIASIVSGSFVVGLVTRMMLAGFGDRTTRDFVDELDAIAASPNEFIQGYGNDALSFQNRFRQVAQNNSIQPSGLFLGWNAGGALSGADAEVREAVWRILHLRFAWGNLGELTGYGLSYCLGFAHVQFVLRAANTLHDQGRIAAPDLVLAKMRDDRNISDWELTIIQLFEHLMTSFGSAARSTSDSRRVTNFRDYLQGYQRGSIRGANEVFATTLRIGYGLGYEDGFHIGYARGYSDGYKAGYKDGQDVNWGAVLHDIATVVDDVATVVALFA